MAFMTRKVSEAVTAQCEEPGCGYCESFERDSSGHFPHGRMAHYMVTGHPVTETRVTVTVTSTVTRETGDGSDG